MLVLRESKLMENLDENIVRAKMLLLMDDGRYTPPSLPTPGRGSSLRLVSPENLRD